VLESTGAPGRNRTYGTRIRNQYSPPKLAPNCILLLNILKSTSLLFYFPSILFSDNFRLFTHVFTHQKPMIMSWDSAQGYYIEEFKCMLISSSFADFDLSRHRNCFPKAFRSTILLRLRVHPSKTSLNCVTSDGNSWFPKDVTLSLMYLGSVWGHR